MAMVSCLTDIYTYIYVVAWMATRPLVGLFPFRFHARETFALQEFKDHLSIYCLISDVDF